MNGYSNWHIKALRKYSGEILKSSLTYLLILLLLLVWNFILDINFEWHSIKPFTPPSVFHRVFYSAFIFWTFGRALYYMGFYKLLHDVLVKAIGMRELYDGIKAVIWVGMIIGSYLYVVPWLFKIFNSVASVLFNAANFVLYISEPIGIAFILILTYKFVIWRFKLTDPPVLQVITVWGKKQ